MFSLVVAADRKRGIGRGGTLPWKLKGDMRWFRELTTCPDTAAFEARYQLDIGLRDKRPHTWETLTSRIADVTPGPPTDRTGPTAKAAAAGLPEPTPAARNAVLMGRKTWDSLPARFRPLPQRLNGVISRTLPPGVFQGSHHVWPSLEAALKELDWDPTVKNIFVVGGGEIFAEALRRPDCRKIYLTDIEAEFSCDVFLKGPNGSPEDFPGSDFRETACSPTLEEAGTSYRFRVLERPVPKD